MAPNDQGDCSNDPMETGDETCLLSSNEVVIVDDCNNRGEGSQGRGVSGVSGRGGGSGRGGVQGGRGRDGRGGTSSTGAKRAPAKKKGL